MHENSILWSELVAHGHMSIASRWSVQQRKHLALVTSHTLSAIQLEGPVPVPASADAVARGGDTSAELACCNLTVYHLPNDTISLDDETVVA